MEIETSILMTRYVQTFKYCIKLIFFNINTFKKYFYASNERYLNFFYIKQFSLNLSTDWTTSTVTLFTTCFDKSPRSEEIRKVASAPQNAISS